MNKIKDYSLYLVISEEYGRGRSALDIARGAIAGGVDVIQMREKKKSAGELFALGKDLADICRRRKTIFIVNDDPMLARAVDADGVHLGQVDIGLFSLETCRRILGRDKIIGVSTATLEQFREADNQDFDYIAFGPIFPTEIKDGATGTKDVGKILRLAKKPVVFIGGITLANVGELLEKGATHISLIRGIIGEPDIKAAAKRFREIMDGFKEKVDKNG